MGSGFKDFAPGDILTAADVDGYLMRQTVMTFADASARDTALSGVLDEGMVAYLEDSDYFTVYDGSAWVVYGNTPAYELVEFTSSGTFTKATYPWGKSVRVRVVGGGGAGGGAAATSAGEVSGGGGGGAGGYAEVRLAMSALSASETVTIGSGGAGVSGDVGGNGGGSSFGSHAVTGGGIGGGELLSGSGFRVTGGLGGAGTTGDIVADGAPGDYCYAPSGTSVTPGGNGGSGPYGGGGRGSISGTGDAADGFGAGGGGTSRGTSAAAGAGGAGSGGIVIVEIFG